MKGTATLQSTISSSYGGGEAGASAEAGSAAAEGRQQTVMAVHHYTDTVIHSRTQQSAVRWATAFTLQSHPCLGACLSGCCSRKPLPSSQRPVILG
jgi:hypothetical protein